MLFFGYKLELTPLESFKLGIIKKFKWLHLRARSSQSTGSISESEFRYSISRLHTFYKKFMST